MTKTTLALKALARAPKEKQKEGHIPAVFYGAQAKSTPIFINAQDFKKVFSQAGESTAFTLTTDHGAETALVHEVQYHPVKNTPTHVDFYVLEKGQKVHVQVPLLFTGESPAVKAGGILVKVLHELSIEGEAVNLPHEISVDISTLATAQDVVKVKDLNLPKGITLYHINEEDVVASIAEAIEETDTPAQVDLSAIEVEKKGKKEEEGEAPAA